MRTLLVVNPASGQGKAAQEKRKLLDLAAMMPQVRTETTSDPEAISSLAAQAAAEHYDLIVAAGGDGTINAVVNGVGDSRIPLGIIPLGTGNVLAHHLGIPVKNVEDAVRVLYGAKVASIDVARANGRRFTLMAGFGFDAAVVGAVSPKVKDVLGTMAYAPAVLGRLLKYAPTNFRLTLDDESTLQVKAYAVIVANCGTYAYNFRIAPDARIDDGLLDVLVFEAEKGSTLHLIGQALDTLFQQRLLGTELIYLKAAKLTVESDPHAMVQIDGDLCGTTPMDVEVIPGAVKLMVP